MSFSYDVKEEISKHMPTARHCQIAELAAILMNVGEWQQRGGIFLQTEQEIIIKKIAMLLRKLYNVEWALPEKAEQGSGKSLPEKAGQESGKAFPEKAGQESGKSLLESPVQGTRQAVRIASPELAEKIRQSIKYEESKDHRVSEMLLKNSCCRKAYLQGTFLCIGSVSDPEKSYHLEFVCEAEPQALQIQELVREMDLEAKVTRRKKYYIVYMKESEAIVEMLGILGAHKALMEMENSRILKEVRNSVNRVCNCDSANINKTIRAAEKQSEDIRYLRDEYGFDRLSPALREMAMVRLEHPDTPLKELGEYLDPPVGKSGVNHRLRKLSELAEDLRNGFLGKCGETP